MANMKSIQFPGSNTVFEVTDAQARAQISQLQTQMGQVNDSLNSMGDDISAAQAAAAAAGTLVGPTETSPSEAAHAAGEYLIYNGALYEVTAAIAVGDTLTVGTNIAAVPKGVAGGVTELKSAIDENLMDYVHTINPTNWYNPSGMASGVLGVDGSVTPNDSRVYSNYYIPVVPGNTVRLTRTDNSGSLYIYKVTAYDSEKNVLSAKGMNSAGYTYLIPSGVAYIKFTMNTQSVLSTTMLTVSGDKPTTYSAYFDPYNVLTKNFLTADADAIMQLLTNGTFSTKNLANRYGCALPKTKFFQTIGLPETWYKKNMVTPPTEYVNCGIGTAYCTDDGKGVTFQNESALSSVNGYTWYYYDVLLNLVDYTNGTGGYGWPRRIIAEDLPNCSVLVIGDSTVDHDVMTGTMLSYFTGKGKTLTLLGTLGSDGNYNEGRAGWTSADYFTDKQYNGVTNPFYNPTSETFDFSYYMTNQGYSGVDYVVIQLGINDLYHSNASAIEPLWNNISGMIDSIISYDSNIKVILNLPTTPNSDPSQHSVSEFLYRNIVMRYNEYAEKNALSKYGTASVRCSYCHLILDPDTDIRDNVHPTNAGYGKMAMEVINQINCWNAGV